MNTKTTTSLRRCLPAIIIFLFASVPLRGQNTPPSPARDFDKTEAMIPMRDGVRLYTQVYTPTRADEPFPILLLRTPYGLGDLTAAQLAAGIPELAADGYIFVRQDIRGRFKSEGEFVMLRQPRDPTDKKAIDEGTDTYDTIQWLLKNVSNHNGRVGMAARATAPGSP